MSTHQTPSKGDIIINPTTQRPVRVGGRIWHKLVKKGIVKGHYKPKPEPKPEPVEPKPEPTEPTTGLSEPEQVSKLAKLAAKTLIKNVDVLADSDDIDLDLENMILAKLKSTSKGSKKQQEHNQAYIEGIRGAKKQSCGYEIEEWEEDSDSDYSESE